MKTTRWTQPRLTVVSRTLDENVLAFCKGWESETQSYSAQFTSCSYTTSSISCTGCAYYQTS